MKNSLKILLVAIFSVVFFSCTPKHLEVQDIRDLESITLKINNENLQWAAGEVRMCTIDCKPDIAVISTYNLVQNIDGMVEIDRTETPNVFRVMARKAGKVRLEAMAIDHNGIVKSDEMDFTINGTYQPKMSVKLKRLSDDTKKSFPKIMVCDVGDAFEVETISDNSSVIFKIVTSDARVMSVTNIRDGKWALSADYPGRTELTVVMQDRYGDRREKTYEIVVFGHAILKAEFNLHNLLVGVSVPSYNYDPVLASLELNGNIYGWPEGHWNMRISKKLGSAKYAFSIERGASYDDILYVKPEADEILTLPPLTDGGKVINYGVYGITLNYELSLDSPYIIIDEITDDGNEKYKDFTIKATVKQNGIADVVEVEDDEAEEVSSGGVHIGGWYEHDIIVNFNCRK